MTRLTKKIALSAAFVALGIASIAFGARAQGAAKPGDPFPEGALAPDNLAKPRPKPPLNLTGTWMVDLSSGFSSFMFGPNYPKFKPAAQALFDEGKKATAEGRPFHDDIGQCFPAGMPMIMTRVWPIAMIQTPTVIYMVSGFENALRLVYIDGRKHLGPDLGVPSYHGEWIGTREGDTLVHASAALTRDRRSIGTGVQVSKAFHIIEHLRL